MYLAVNLAALGPDEKINYHRVGGHHMNNRHLLDAVISGIALVVFVVGTIAVLYGAGFAG